MKILVTGATGNVGRLVVDELLSSAPTTYARSPSIRPRPRCPPGSR